jgi:hypothetical protein
MSAAARPRRHRGGSWPTPDHTRLLRAALFTGEAGRRALDEWRARTALDDLDPGSRRLLPLLYTRLVAESAGDPLLPRLEQAYRDTAAGNRVLLQAIAGVVRTLNRAAIPTLVLKGLALLVRGLIPVGARPMADADLLVPETRALAARDELLGTGWQPVDPVDVDLLAVRHSIGFVSAAGARLDLHWHVLAECLEPGADDTFWQAAEPVEVGGAPSRTLSAADMLLHTVVHGVRWSRMPPVRWAADAAILLRSARPPVDWDRLADEAERRRLVLPVGDALGYLHDALELPVPDAVRTRLSRVAVSIGERIEHRLRMGRRTLWRQALLHWFRHRRLSPGGTLLADFARFPAYVRRRWGPRAGRQLFRRIVGGGASRRSGVRSSSIT